MTNRLLLILLVCLLAIFISAAGCGNSGGSSPAASTSVGGDNSGHSNDPGNDNPAGSTTGYATLSWQAPSTYVDGSPMTTLAGFKVYYGTSPRNYSHVVNVGDRLTYSINDLTAGTYYFSVTAYDAEGNESDYSVEVSKTI